MTISFSGLASGLDTSSWVQSLTALKRAKVTTLEEEKDNLTITKDTLSSIKSFFASFRSMLERVTDTKFGIASMDLFAQNLAESSNTSILTATATTEAKEATYNILVDKLASETQAYSRYSYVTTIEQTTIADYNSKLVNLGVNIDDEGSSISVLVDGIERGINLTKKDTISDLINKLKQIGVDADYNAESGIFSVNIGENDIIDTSGTGIAEALHLTGVNEGYTSNALQVSYVDLEYSSANRDTSLSELGITESGTVAIRANGEITEFDLNPDTTLGEFIDVLNDANIEASIDATGLFTISDAEIVTDEINLSDVLGFDIETYSKSQKSDNLTFSTVITSITYAKSDTLLSELGEGINIEDTQSVIVQNSNGENTTIDITSSTTIGDLIAELQDAGFYARLNESDGSIDIAGGQIIGGSFDLVDALGLSTEPYTALVTGNSLQESVTVSNVVDFNTQFIRDMGVSKGYLEIETPEGDKFYEKIYDGMTIADFIADMGNLGIYTELDLETGIMTITGGKFRTMTADEVIEAVPLENDEDYQKGTNLLTALYGQPEIQLNQTSVSSTRAMSKALTQSVITTVNASLTTTLGRLGLEDGTAIFNVRGEEYILELDGDMTIGEFIDALAEEGISAEFNSDTSRIKINNAALTGGTSNLSEVLNLTTEVAGKYKTSNELYSQATFSVNATEETTLSALGITDDMSELERTLSLYTRRRFNRFYCCYGRYNSWRFSRFY